MIEINALPLRQTATICTMSNLAQILKVTKLTKRRALVLESEAVLWLIMAILKYFIFSVLAVEQQVCSFRVSSGCVYY